MKKKFRCYQYLIIFLLAISSSHAFSQAPPKAPATPRITITGTVIDTTGKRIEGASIVAVNRKNVGTTTDVNGRFILDAEPGTQLIISYVGYAEQRVTVSSDHKEVTVALRAAAAEESVVVTAYGKKQRKEAVVGSVTSVNPEDLRIPSSNLTNALAGQISGVVAFQRGGQPGADNSQFFIRGVTTLGYSASPLILVDNVELTSNDLARLNVDDIASFSILKDASAAALYGARGANGVILVTTKEGKVGKARINIRYENSISKPTKSIQLADPVTYMKDYNEALTTRGAPRFWTPNQILDATATMNRTPGYNGYLAPAVDWMSMLFKKQTTTQRGNFSVQGGSDLARYYISGSYDRDNGILQNNPVNNFNSGMKYENYQLRSNVNVKVTKTTEVIVRLWGNFNDYTGPITDDQSGLATDLYDRVLHTSPVAFPAWYLPDSANLLTKHILFGNSTATGGLQDNPYADLMRGYKSLSESRMSAQFEVNQNFGFITKGLSFHGIFSTNRYSYFDLTRAYNPFYYDIGSYDPKTGKYTLTWLNNSPGSAQEFLNYSPGNKNISTYIYMQGSLDYDRTFGRHHVGGTLLATREQTLNANVYDPSTNLPSLQASLPARNLGVSGRASYSYGSRYYMEFNFGYNGSEKFAPNHRYGFFPTIGAGWVVSNEQFYKGGITDIITRLKIRGSYGLVGNDNIGKQRFFYLSSVTPDDNINGPRATFGTGNAFTQYGTTIQAYPNPDVTWETSQKSNLGLELTIGKNLNIIAEIYHEYRYNILIPRGYIPVTAGIEGTASANLQANLGTAYSKGLDLHMDYKQRITKDLQVTVMGNLTVTSNKAGRLEEPQYPYPYLFHSGQPINQQFGYIAERLFVDDKEAANSPTQLFGGALPQGGDIKYRDVNKDGVINSYDQVPIGLPTTPQIVYGFGFSAIYKQFDLNAFFQGLGRESFFMNPTAKDDRYNGIYGTAPFANNAQLLKAYADDHWSLENQNLYALWPRLSITENSNNIQSSSWWLRDGSFMRLKSLEAGYTFPKKWTRRLFMDNARIYFNGLNLITWSHFNLWDPEMAGQGFGYPVQKVFNVGLNMNF